MDGQISVLKGISQSPAVVQRVMLSFSGYGLYIGESHTTDLSCGQQAQFSSFLQREDFSFKNAQNRLWDRRAGFGMAWQCSLEPIWFIRFIGSFMLGVIGLGSGRSGQGGMLMIWLLFCMILILY